MAKTNLFHIQETILRANGFVKNVWTDKDSSSDSFDTLKHEEYTKKFNNGLEISVCHSYSTDDEKTYKLVSTSIELCVYVDWCELSITNLSDFLTLIRILKGDE